MPDYLLSDIGLSCSESPSSYAKATGTAAGDNGDEFGKASSCLSGETYRIDQHPWKRCRSHALLHDENPLAIFSLSPLALRQTGFWRSATRTAIRFRVSHTAGATEVLQGWRQLRALPLQARCSWARPRPSAVSARRNSQAPETDARRSARPACPGQGVLQAQQADQRPAEPDAQRQYRLKHHEGCHYGSELCQGNSCLARGQRFPQSGYQRISFQQHRPRADERQRPLLQVDE